MTDERFEKLESIISKQQIGKEGTPEFAIGEQLKDIARGYSDIAEILAQDLALKEMDLTAAAAKLKEYADKNRGEQSCFCITPAKAEEILRGFYALPEAKTENESGGMIMLEDYL